MVQEAPLITVHANWETAIAHVRQALASAGINVIRSFDLQVARAESGGQVCPTHGTAQCDGQMIVLLVYDGDNPPLTLEVYGHDGLAHFAIVDTPKQRSDPHLVAKILQGLKEVNISGRNPEGVSNVG